MNKQQTDYAFDRINTIKSKENSITASGELTWQGESVGESPFFYAKDTK